MKPLSLALAAILAIALAFFIRPIGIQPAFADAPPILASPELDEQLINSAAQGRLDSVKIEAYQGANVNAVDRYKRTPLSACAGGEGPEDVRLAIAKLLVGLGADVNQHAVFQPTPLLCAIDYRQSPIAHYLLDNGADPLCFDSKGRTALMEAARTGQLDLVNALIAKGADVRARDHQMRTALMWANGAADQSGDPATTPAVEIPSEDGYTTIRYVEQNEPDPLGGGEIVRALLAAGSEIDSVDINNDTALMLAARDGKTEIVRSLVEGHANWRLRNDISDNALMCAEKGNHTDTVGYLKTVFGTTDPVYAALHKRLKSERDQASAVSHNLAASPPAEPQTDLPGVTLTVWADKGTLRRGEAPFIHYVLHNDTPAPISLLTPIAGMAPAGSTVMLAWSVVRMQPGQPNSPAAPVFAGPPAGESEHTKGAATGLTTIPPHGTAEIPTDLARQITRATSDPGVYRAAFFFVSNPAGLQGSVPQASLMPSNALPCHLVSNELTIVTE